MKRYISGIVLAPLAGGAAVFLATLAASRDVTAAGMLALWAAIICLVYVLVVGTIAFVYARASGRTPPLWAAFTIAVVTAVVPFAVSSFYDATLTSAMAFPALAAVSAAATAWTFWRVALAPRATA